MGTGKTLAGIETIGQMLLRKQVNNVIVLVSKTLLTSWNSAMASRYPNLAGHVSFLTHQTRALKHVTTKKTLVVIDEAHNARNNTKRSKNMVELCASPSVTHVLLLTGTPIVNYEVDLVNLMLMLYGRPWDDRASFINMNGIGSKLLPEKRTIVYDLLRAALDHHDDESLLRLTTTPSAHSTTISDMPTVEMHHVNLVMDDEFYELYMRVEKNQIKLMKANKQSNSVQCFLNGVRRALNAPLVGQEWDSSKPLPLSNKIKWLSERVDEWKVQDGQKLRMLVFTQFIEYGAEKVYAILQRAGIPYGVINGDTPLAERARIVDDFNRGIKDAVIFTQAASEGVSFKGTKRVVVLEPTWNAAKLDQAIMRGVRTNSHSHLPLAERRVEVYLLRLSKPASSSSSSTSAVNEDGSINISKARCSADDLLYQYIDQKRKLQQRTKGLLLMPSNDDNHDSNNPAIKRLILPDALDNVSVPDTTASIVHSIVHSNVQQHIKYDWESDDDPSDDSSSDNRYDWASTDNSSDSDSDSDSL